MRPPPRGPALVAALLLAALLAPAALAADTAPPWPQFQRDAANTGAWHTAGPGTGRVLWSTNLAGGVYATPVPADGHVFVGTNAGKLVALDPATGKVVWQRNLADRMSASPVVVNGTLYVGAGPELLAMDPTNGTVRWRYTFPGDVFFSAAVAQGLVAASEENGALAVLHAADGSVAWNRSLGTAIATPARIHGGLLFVGVADGTLRAYDLGNGTLAWSYAAGSSVFSAPAFANGTAYAGAVDGWAYAVNLTNGAARWNGHIDPRGVTSSPALSRSLVVYGTDQEGLVALYRSNGTVAWSAPPDGNVFGSPVVTPHAIYYAGTGGFTSDHPATVRAVDPRNGTVLWATKLSGSVHGSASAVDGRLLVPVWDKGVVALDAGIGPAPRSPVPAPALGALVGFGVAAALLKRR